MTYPYKAPFLLIVNDFAPRVKKNLTRVHSGMRVGIVGKLRAIEPLPLSNVINLERSQDPSPCPPALSGAGERNLKHKIDEITPQTSESPP